MPDQPVDAALGDLQGDVADRPEVLRAAGPPVVPGVDAATVAFARPNADQVVVAAEVVTQPTGTPIAFDGATPHSIALAVTTSSAATLDITWSVQVGGTSPVIEHRFRLDLSG